jgi:hypothetical protein
VRGLVERSGVVPEQIDDRIGSRAEPDEARMAAMPAV